MSQNRTLSLNEAGYLKDRDLNVCCMIAELKASLIRIRHSGSLGARAMQSGFWITGGFAIQRGLQLVSNLILTRLLFPEAFGIMALATVFLVGLTMFSDIGLKPAVIRDPRGDDPDFLNTAWTLQVIRGLGLCFAACLLAYPLSLLYNQPILFPLLMALSATSAISGFQTIGLATAERKLDFLRPTTVTILGQIVSTATTIVLAYYMQSVWALAVGTIAGSFGSLIIGHLALSEHRHRLRFEQRAARSIVAFGKWIFLSTFITFMGGEGLRAIQAGFISTADFGVLAISYTIAAIAVELPLKLTSSIGLSALSEAHRANQSEVTAILQKFRKRILIMSFVFATTVALTSNVIIEALYDPRYHDASNYVAILTLSNSLALGFSGYMTHLLVLGNSRAYFRFQVLTTIFRLVLLALGNFAFGISGMLMGIGIANFLILTIFWFYLSKSGVRFLYLDLLYVGAISIVSLIYLFAVHTPV